MITGHKDTDLRVLLELDNREFLIFCGKPLEIKNKYINKLCKDETLWKNRLFKYYAEIYPEVNQTWKNLYLSLVYHMDKYKYKKDYDSFLKATKRGHLSVVKYLISFPNLINPSANSNDAIAWASYNGHLSVVKYLIGLPKEYKIRPDAQNNLPIRWASENGHLDIIKYLIDLPQEYGINPAAGDNDTIRRASANGHLSVVKYLMSLPKEYGINPTAYNNDAIKWAKINNQKDIVEYLSGLPGVHL